MKFNSVKPGDLVMISTGQGHRKDEVMSVTATQFALSSGWRFLRSNGVRVGESNYRTPTRAHPFDEERFREAINDIEQRRFRNECIKAIRGSTLNDLSTEDLQAIRAIIHKANT